MVQFNHVKRQNRCFSQESTSGGVSFFHEIALLLFAVCKFIEKETLVQLSSYEFCEIFKKTFLIEHRCFYKKRVLSILSLGNLTIEYKLKVVSYSWKSESRVNAN